MLTRHAHRFFIAFLTSLDMGQLLQRRLSPAKSLSSWIPEDAGVPPSCGTVSP